MSEIAKIYSDRDSQKAFEKSLASDIRAELHAQAEARIIEALHSTASELARHCLTVPQAAIVLEGWRAFNEKIAQLSRDEVPITAVGVDLSNASDELAVECSYYSDRSFAFSASDREQILAENQDYGTPWAGAFEDVDGALHVRGLSELGAIIFENPLSLESTLPAGADPSLFASVKLASWYLTLRFHQAIKSELERQGLFNRIPLLVGQNMPGPWLEAVYLPAKAFEVVAAPKPKLSIEEQKAKAARAMDADVEWQVQRFVQFRSMFSKEATRIDPAMAGYLRSFAAEEEDWKQRAGLVGYPKSWEQSEEAFEGFLAAYRHARAPDKYPPPPSPPPRPPTAPGARPSWRKLFGTKGL